jgi:WD40 repeat protein
MWMVSHLKKNKRGMSLVWATVPVFFGAALLAQTSNNTRRDLPTNKVESIPSPNGRWVLIASPSESRTVTLLDKERQKRTLIKEYDGSLQIGWSPDSSAFFLNDAYASNLEDAYVYLIAFGKPVRLSDFVFGHDSEAKSAAKKADHTYFRVGNWTNGGSLLLEFCGHGGEAPGIQFDFIYRVDLHDLEARNVGVTVKRVSRKLGPLDLSASDCTF